MTPISSTLALRRILTKALLPCPLIEAAALYGSTARGDAEAYSDLDLLVVCEGSRKRETYTEITATLSADFKRVSICLYTPRELFFLAKQGSLFLLHLSKEALLLFDHTGRLSHLMATFQPKNSYQQDFKDSLGLLAPLRNVILGVPNQFHRLAYIYSLFRVFGVYLLAENQIYEFSKAKMVTALADKYPTLRPEITALSSLRTLNSSFFGGESCSLANDDHNSILRTSSSALAALCGESLECVEVPYSAAAKVFVNACRSQSKRLDYRLRTWFLILLYDGLNLYCSAVHRAPMDNFTEHRLLELIASDAPVEIRSAASVGIDYLRNYPLRYFLLEQSKIPVDQACAALQGVGEWLAEESSQGTARTIELSAPGYEL